MATTSISFRLDDELRKRLGELAKVTDRSMNYLANEALQEYLNVNEWQVQGIRQALDEADRGASFATDQEVRRRFARWGVNYP